MIGLSPQEPELMSVEPAWQTWLLEVLDEHRLQITADIRTMLQDVDEGPEFSALDEEWPEKDSLALVAPAAEHEGRFIISEVEHGHAVSSTANGDTKSDGTGLAIGKGDNRDSEMNSTGSCKTFLTNVTTDSPPVQAAVTTDTRESFFKHRLKRTKSRMSMSLEKLTTDSRGIASMRSTTSHEAHAAITRNLTNNNMGSYDGLNRCGLKLNWRIIDTVVGFCILGNTISMVIQLQWFGYLAMVSLGLYSRDGSWDHAGWWFEFIEHLFNVIFTIELILRLSAFGRRFFHEGFNVVDFILVIVTNAQMYILEPLTRSSGAKMTLFRLLRFARAVRVLRMIKVMRLFAELRILVHTFFHSLQALGWSIVFLLFCVVTGALFMSFSLHDFITEDSNDYDLRMWTFTHYGSAARASYTLFEVTLAGGWPNYFRPLVERVSVWYSVFIFFYVNIVVFAVTRIITALFIKETLSVSSQDTDAQAHELSKRKQQYLEKLRSLFHAINISGDGRVTFSEFKRVCSNKETVIFLKMLDLEVQNAEALFHLLDNSGSGEISFDDFLTGVQRLKGHARALDVVAMMRAQDSLEMQVQSMNATMKDIHTRICSGHGLQVVPQKASSTRGIQSRKCFDMRLVHL